VSKLAGDVATRKLKAEQSQRIIDGHLVERNWLTEMLRIQTNCNPHVYTSTNEVAKARAFSALIGSPNG
jgi:hypothetical protein